MSTQDEVDTVEILEDLASWAWTIITNVDEGNGMGVGGASHQTEEWRAAARRWRDAYHETLKGSEPETVRADLEKVQWTAFQSHLSLIREHLSGEVPPGELDHLVELGKRVETAAMARVVRWMRDTTLAKARAEDPGLALWDAVDADLVVLLKNLERPS